MFQNQTRPQGFWFWDYSLLQLAGRGKVSARFTERLLLSISTQNTAYGRHWFFWQMRIEATIPFFLCRWSAMELRWKYNWTDIEVPLKCHWSGNNQQPTATATYLTVLTPPLSRVTVGWSKTERFNNLRRKTVHTLFLKIVSSRPILEYFFWPEVSTTPWRGFFAMAQTDRQPWQLFDWIGP